MFRPDIEFGITGCDCEITGDDAEGVSSAESGVGRVLSQTKTDKAMIKAKIYISRDLLIAAIILLTVSLHRAEKRCQILC